MRKVIYSLLFLLSFAFIPSVFAVHDGVNDDFEDYSVGALTGNGGWSGSVSFLVSPSMPYEGSKGVKVLVSSAVSIEVAVVASADFNQTWYMRTSASSGEIADLVFGGTGSDRLYINFGSCASGNICYYNYVGGWNTIMAYSANTWYKFTIDFDADNTFDLWIDDVLKVGDSWAGASINYTKMNKRPFLNTMFYDFFYNTVPVSFVTTYNHTGISNLWVNGTQKSNSTLTEISKGYVANLTASASDGYIFLHWKFDNGTIYSTSRIVYLTMSQNYTMHAYAVATTYFHAVFLDGITSMVVNGSSVLNNSVTAFNGENISISAVGDFRYFLIDSDEHTHLNPMNLVMSLNHTVIAYPSDIAANNSGIAILIIGIVAIFIIIIVVKR